MICNNCGAQVADNAIFCPECGAAFMTNGGTVPQPQAPQPQAPVFEDIQPIEVQPIDVQPIEVQPIEIQPLEVPPVAAPQAQPQVFRQEPPQQVFRQEQPQTVFNQQGFPQQQNYPQAQNYSQPAFQQNPRSYTPETAALAKSALVWGILGLSFSCSVYFAVLGIIFSAIGLTKAGRFAALDGALYGKAKVGRGLALGGLIAGIVFTVVLVSCVGAVGCASFYY